MNNLTNRELLALLTPQQITVLEYASQGFSTAATGARMGITAKGVKFHRTGIYKTLGVSNIMQALTVYESLTTDDSIDLTNVPQMAPGYYRIKAELVALQTKYTAALTELSRLRKVVAKFNGGPLTELVSGQGNVANADKGVTSDCN